MDICTLVIQTMMTAIGCLVAEACHPEAHRMICIPAHAISCPQPVAYDCVKPDGAHYRDVRKGE